MDHEPDYGSVCLCGDLGSGSCPPSLPVYGFPGKGRLCSPHMGGYDAYNITDFVHTQACFWCAEGRPSEKLMVWFLEVLNIASQYQFCLINVSHCLGTGRKMVMWIIFQ